MKRKTIFLARLVVPLLVLTAPVVEAKAQLGAPGYEQVEPSDTQSIDDAQEEEIMAAIQATGIDIEACSREDARIVIRTIDELLKRDDWEMVALFNLIFTKCVIVMMIAEKPEDLSSLMPTIQDACKRYPQHEQLLQELIGPEDEYSLEKHFEESDSYREEFELEQKRLNQSSEP